jgi:hypothetical protein
VALAFQALEGFFAEHERLPYAKRILLWEARMERLWQRYASIYFDRRSLTSAAEEHAC